MSTWLGEGITRQIVKHYFWVRLWECFQKRLAFEPIDWLKETILQSRRIHTLTIHPIHWQSEKKKTEEGGFALGLNWNTHLFLPLDIKILVPWFWCLRIQKGTETIGSSGSQYFRFGQEIHCWLLGVSSLQSVSHNTFQLP